MEWYKNIESVQTQTNENIKENELDLWHQEVIENYEYKDMFKSFIDTLKTEDKEKFLNILKNIPDEDLKEYLEERFESDSEENWEYFFDTYSEDYYKVTTKETEQVLQENGESIDTINQEVKDTITAISQLTEEEKNNQIIIDVYIKKINELKSINHNNTELNLLDEKLNILNSYTELNETNNIKSDEAENQRVEAEIQRVEAEEQRVEAEIMIIWHNFIEKNSELFLQTDPEFINVINNLKIAIKEKDPKKHTKILEEYFSQPWKAKEFFTKLAEQNPEQYNEVYKALSNISPEIKDIFEKEGIQLILVENKEELSSTISWGKYNVYFEKDSNIEKKGSIISLWDKYIDISKNPPVWYITLENWLKLKTKITAPDTMQIRSEYSKKLKEYEKQVWVHEKNIESLNSEILDLKNDITDKKDRIEQINDSTISEIDKERFIKSINEIIEANIQLIKTKEKIIKQEEWEIQTLTIKFKIVKEQFEDEMQEKLENSKDQLLKWDEKVRKTLQFLDSIGIDSSLMSGLESMIKQINRNSALRNKLWFDRRIDLSNNDLWIRNDWWEDENRENSSTTKQKFASIMNILLTWSKDIPINSESMTSYSVTFKNEAWEDIAKDKVMWDIKNKMWISIYGHMFKNAMEYDPNK